MHVYLVSQQLHIFTKANISVSLSIRW